jgi:hypothetical protein
MKRRLSHDAELNEVISSYVIWNSAVEWMEWNVFKSQNVVTLLFLFAIIVDYVKSIST